MKPQKASEVLNRINELRLDYCQDWPLRNPPFGINNDRDCIDAYGFETYEEAKKFAEEFHGEICEYILAPECGDAWEREDYYGNGPFDLCDYYDNYDPVGDYTMKWMADGYVAIANDPNESAKERARARAIVKLLGEMGEDQLLIGDCEGRYDKETDTFEVDYYEIIDRYTMAYEETRDATAHRLGVCVWVDEEEEEEEKDECDFGYDD